MPVLSSGPSLIGGEDRADDAGGNLVPKFENVVERTVEGVGPICAPVAVSIG
jgi:hypothetical protein